MSPSLPEGANIDWLDKSNNKETSHYLLNVGNNLGRYYSLVCDNYFACNIANSFGVPLYEYCICLLHRYPSGHQIIGFAALEIHKILERQLQISYEKKFAVGQALFKILPTCTYHVG
jgi:hypothetical protein